MGRITILILTLTAPAASAGAQGWDWGVLASGGTGALNGIFLQERADQLAGIGSGLLSMGEGAGRAMNHGPTQQVIVEMAEGVLLAAPVGPQICLTLLAVSRCDREQLGYELGQFTMQVGPLLNEALTNTGSIPKVI